jgi:low affinity Fe/Cu permease
MDVIHPTSSHRSIDEYRCRAYQLVLPMARWATDMKIDELFDRFSTGCARFTGRPGMLALCITVAAIGIFAYFSGSEHFLNGANLSISILTLLILPILQATQNRDGAALQAKIDELIKSNEDARNSLIGLERRGEAEIEAVRTSDGAPCDEKAS